MAKKENKDSEIVKYILRFTQDVYSEKKNILEHKKGSTVSCGPEAFAIYNGLGVVEVVSSKSK